MTTETVRSKVEGLDPGLPVPNPTTPFWQIPLHSLAAVASETLPAAADVVVIGSGMSGCSVAKGLLEGDATLSVTVLEARGIASGATSRNGGHIVSASFESFPAMIEAFGEKAAAEVAEFTLRNIDRSFDMVDAIGDAALKEASEARCTEKVLVFEDEATLEHHREILQTWNRTMPANRKDWYKIIDAKEAEERFGLRDVAGAAVGRAAAVWPYRLWAGVWKHLLDAYKDRLTIETYTPATAVRSAGHGSGYVVSTPRGDIAAGRVVYCTNGYASHLLPRLRGKIFPFRGTMSTQDLGAAFPNHGAHRSWSFFSQPRLDPGGDSANMGLYYLTQNPTSGYMFLGGEHARPVDVITSDDSQLNALSAENVVKVLPRVFRGAQSPDVKAVWSGIMGFTRDGLPVIGHLPEAATGRSGGGEWIAAGFNGYGTGYCLSCGTVVAEMILGKDVSSWVPQAILINEERFMGTLTDGTSWAQLGV